MQDWGHTCNSSTTSISSSFCDYYILIFYWTDNCCLVLGINARPDLGQTCRSSSTYPYFNQNINYLVWGLNAAGPASHVHVLYQKQNCPGPRRWTSGIDRIIASLSLMMMMIKMIMVMAILFMMIDIYVLWWSVCLSQKMITSSLESLVSTLYNSRLVFMVFRSSGLVFHGSMSVFVGF